MATVLAGDRGRISMATDLAGEPGHDDVMFIVSLTLCKISMVTDDYGFLLVTDILGIHGNKILESWLLRLVAMLDQFP